MTGPITKEAEAQVEPLRLLVVGDDPDDLDLCLRGLKESKIDFRADVASTREDFMCKLREGHFDAVLSDYRMKGWSGLDALAAVKEICPDVPLILLPETLGDELAVECIKLGVTDCVLKHNLARLPMAIRRAQEEKSRRKAEGRALEALIESEEHYRTLVQDAPEAIVVLDADKGRFASFGSMAGLCMRTASRAPEAPFASTSPSVQCPKLRLRPRRTPCPSTEAPRRSWSPKITKAWSTCTGNAGRTGVRGSARGRRRTGIAGVQVASRPHRSRAARCRAPQTQRPRSLCPNLQRKAESAGRFRHRLQPRHCLAPEGPAAGLVCSTEALFATRFGAHSSGKHSTGVPV